MKYIYLLISIFIFNINYAHKNVQLEFKRGKVILITSTHDYNEEINKSLILTEYTNRLLDSLGYKKNIKILNFQSERNFLNAHYDNNDGELSFNRFHLDLLDIKTYLNFIHYIIVNEKKLDLSQPVDSKVLKENYKLVDKIISLKMKRPDEIEKLDNLINYSYYYKDNNYYFHTLNTNIEVYNINNFEQIQSVSTYKFLVFINDIEFDLVEEKKHTNFKLSVKNPSSLSFRIIHINDYYSFIQYGWKKHLVFLNLKNDTITEDFYNKLN